MVLALLPLLVSIVGAITYLASTGIKASELGRLAFAYGLVSFLLLTGRDLLLVHVAH